MAKDKRQPKPHIAGRNEPEQHSQSDTQAELALSRAGDIWRSHIAPHARLIGVIVLAVIVALLGKRLYEQKQTEEHGRAWASVETVNEEETLREIAAAHESKTVGQMAAFRLAGMAFQNGENEEALERFNAFVDRFNESPLRDDALLGRAYSLEGLERWEESATAFEDLAASSEKPVISAQAYLGAGRCYVRTNSIEKARQAYENARAAAENTMFAESAMDALYDLEEQG